MYVAALQLHSYRAIRAFNDYNYYNFKYFIHTQQVPVMEYAVTDINKKNESAITEVRIFM